MRLRDLALCLLAAAPILPQSRRLRRRYRHARAALLSRPAPPTSAPITVLGPSDRTFVSDVR